MCGAVYKSSGVCHFAAVLEQLVLLEQRYMPAIKHDTRSTTKTEDQLRTSGATTSVIRTTLVAVACASTFTIYRAHQCYYIVALTGASPRSGHLFGTINGLATSYKEMPRRAFDGLTENAGERIRDQSQQAREEWML